MVNKRIFVSDMLCCVVLCRHGGLDTVRRAGDSSVLDAYTELLSFRHSQLHINDHTLSQENANLQSAVMLIVKQYHFFSFHIIILRSRA